MNEVNSCPNCNSSIRGGMISGTTLLSNKDTALINEYTASKAQGYCSNCGKSIYELAEEKFNIEKRELNDFLKTNISNIPVISINSPLNWDYKILGMVTGQSTTGTGVITEFTSSFTDLFGGQSNRHNQKLKEGEDLCFTQLRIQTLNMGGNAVIATDIDYSEVGSTKGMLMVCMAGTAVKINKMDIFEKEKIEIIENLMKINNRLKVINQFI